MTTTTTMPLGKAIALVVTDRRESYPELTMREAVQVARDTISTDDLYEDECEGHESLDGAHMGETVFCDGTCVQPGLDDAYRAVLGATDTELAAAFDRIRPLDDETPSSAVCPVHGVGCPMWEV